MALHRRDVDRITRRKRPRPLQQVLRPLDVALLDRIDLVHHARQHIECRLDRIAPVDRDGDKGGDKGV